MVDAIFSEPIAKHVWNIQCRLRKDGNMREPSLRETWSRVALAAPESDLRGIWNESIDSIFSILSLPGDAGFERYGEIFDTPCRLGLNGCTVSCPNSARGSVLSQTNARDARKVCS